MEKLSRVLSDFAVEPEKITRVRRGFLLETERGLQILQDYRGGTAKLAAVEALQKSLREQGFFRSDLLLRTKKGELSSRDVDGTVYVLKEWFAGQECDRENRRDLFAGIELLAEVHGLMEKTELKIESENLNTVFEKRIRELRRARNFLKSRRRKTDYESELLRHADYYISCGEKALERLADSGYEKQRKAAVQNGTVVHGAYHYHNILILPAEASLPAGTRKTAVVNFEQMTVGLQVMDVYDYIRKVLEKNAWNRDLGYRLIERYQRERHMQEEEMEILRILFLFPLKYWKLVNHYYNHSKTWLPGKNPEKLAGLVRQEEARMRFMEGI